MKLRGKSALIATTLLVCIGFCSSAFARKRGDLPSSKNGPGTNTDCLDSSSTPYLAVLDGHSTSCVLPGDSTSSTVTYPDLSATFAGSGFSIKITPIVWANGGFVGSANTILQVAVLRPSGSSTTVTVNSLVLNEILGNPTYVPCNMPSSSNQDAGNANGPTMGACMTYRLMTSPALTADTPQYNSFQLLIQEPDPIVLSDNTMTRWDFVAFTQDQTFYLAMDGVPNNSALNTIFTNFGFDFTGYYNVLDLSAAKVNISTTVNGSTAATLGSLAIKAASSAVNDLSTAATPVTAGAYNDYRDTAVAKPTPGNSATNQNDPVPTCFDGDAGTTDKTALYHSVWYTITPQASGNVSVSTDGSRYDTRVYIFTGTPASPNAVTCNDDSAVVNGVQSDTGTFAVTSGAGLTYWIEASEAPKPLGTLLDANGDPILDSGSNFVNDIVPGSPHPVLNLAVNGTGLTPSPSSQSFGNEAVNTTSVARTITLKATGDNLSAIAPSISGDFAISGGTCGSTLSNGSTCTITITFTPAALGTRTGKLTVASSGILGPLQVALSGVGTNPLGFANTSANLGTVYKPNVATTLQTVWNYGSSSLPLAFSISPSIGTDFSVGSGGTCGASLAAHASCTVAFAFSPRTTRTQNATGVVTSGSYSSQIALTASGVLPLTLSPSSLSFGNIFVGKTQTLISKLTNNTPASLPLATPVLTPSGTDFSVASNNCGANLSSGASCSFQIRFAPTAHRNETAAFTFTSGAYSGSLALKGTGLYALAVSPSSIPFGSVPVGTPVLQTVWLTNNMASPITLTQAIAPTGTAFSISGGTCGATVGAHAACTTGVVFLPTVKGPQSATLKLSGGGYSASVTLTGTGQ